jgi:hypothetical protein
MANRGFDGSGVNCAGGPVSPLVGAHHENRPAQVRLTGADANMATGHTYTGGRNSVSMTIDMLGSHVPPPGNVVPVTITLKDGTSHAYNTVAVTRTRVSGRRDADIQSSITIRPSGANATSPSLGNAANDVSFNGTTPTFNNAALTGLLSCTYEGSSAEVDDSGAEANAVLITPGIPEHTTTVEVLGGATLVKGTRASLNLAWHDGGTIGSYTTAEVFDVRDGGTVDAEITTEYVFKPCPAA